MSEDDEERAQLRRHARIALYQDACAARKHMTAGEWADLHRDSAAAEIVGVRTFRAIISFVWTSE